jgi:serine/threonine protein kinase
MTGSRLGKWVLDKELGRGGMGRVYLAHDEKDGGQVAIKVLPPELAQDPGFVQRFQREIDALRQLDHPNIVRFFEAGVENNTFFYVMEYIDGVTYDDLLVKQTRLPWKEVLDTALQLCPALKHAHDRGVIHRDLKPPNLMRAGDGVVKLMDFGIAKVFAGQHLTGTGGVVGTAEFLSPEQAAGKPVTKRSDLYSFGVCLYTLLAGHPPFTGDTVLDLLHKHRYAQFDPPRKLVPEIPYEIDEVVCQLLEKEPAKRPADALVLQRQLEGIRLKLGRKALHTSVDPSAAQTQAENVVVEEAEGGPGPATLMSRLMRQELEEMNRGSAFSQWLNRPAVLVPLFVLCVGLIVWGFFFRSHEESPETASTSSLEADQTALGMALAGIKSTADMSEAERFYRRGLRLCRQGDADGARRTWRGVVQSFGGLEAEQRWVRLAEEGLQGLEKRAPADVRDRSSLPEAVKRYQQLLAQGKVKEAADIREGLEALYGDDPGAADLLQQLRQPGK